MWSPRPNSINVPSVFLQVEPICLLQTEHTEVIRQGSRRTYKVIWGRWCRCLGSQTLTTSTAIHATDSRPDKNMQKNMTGHWVGLRHIQPASVTSPTERHLDCYKWQIKMIRVDLKVQMEPLDYMIELGGRYHGSTILESLVEIIWIFI